MEENTTTPPNNTDFTPMGNEAIPPSPPQYAGFSIRTVAFIIDLLLFGAVTYPLAKLMGFDTFITFNSGIQLKLKLGGGWPNVVLQCLYFALFHSSKWQATPGKMVVGIIVTDLQGKRISLINAVGRYFATILSALILFIGFIMVAFSKQKQGLHDIFAKTYVIVKPKA